MNISHRPPSTAALTALSALQAAVTKTLEQKKKLGHYAVVWKNGEVTEKHFIRIEKHLGVMESAFVVPDNFDDALPEEVENEFYSENL